MTMIENETAYTVSILSGGKIMLDESVMRDFVKATKGCSLWFNEKVAAVGVKLLRGDDHPPYIIERHPGDKGGETGLIDAARFFDKVGLDMTGAEKQAPCHYYEKFQVLEFRVAPPKARPTSGRVGILEDFPALED